MFASGSMKDLNSVERMAFEQIILGMAASSLRCIAFAHKQILEEEHEIGEGREKIEKDRLTLIGLMGDKGPDPCRPGVRKAVDGYNTLLVKDSETKRISSQLDHCRIPTLLSSAKQVVEMNRQYHPIGEPIVKSGAVLQASGLQREPKWGHLRDLNSALFRGCAKVEQLGSSTEVSLCVKRLVYTNENG